MPDQLLYSIDEAAKLLSVSRSTIHALVRDGRLTSVKRGRHRYFTMDDLKAFVDSLREERHADPE